MRRQTVKERIARSISLRQGEVVFPSDFKSMASPSQINRALRTLIDEGRIVRLGYGLYAKARPSVLTGKPVPRVSLPELTQEALERWGIPVRLGEAQAAYAEGKTDQVPMYTAFYTGKHRITRKITVGLRTVRFENKYQSRS
ncbi:MAG: DUF6088 family protein [Pseudohongiellaceae bacterium]